MVPKALDCMLRRAQFSAYILALVVLAAGAAGAQTSSAPAATEAIVGGTLL